MYKRTFLSCFLLLALNTNLNALELPHLIGEGMVVQRDEPIPVWGWAKAGSKISVVFDDQKQTAVTDKNGAWEVRFPKRSAGGPHKLAVEGDGKAFQFQDVWVGDVWVCSGQSNMEWPLRATENAEQAIAAANDNMIRHFKVPRSWASSPEQTLAGGEWQASSPEVAGSFSAVGYYFAKHVRKEVDVPIGLLNSTWGGSNIESWMDAPLLGINAEENVRKLSSLVQDEEREAEKVRQRIKQWPGALDKNYENASADWSAMQLDESDWVIISAPSLWETQAFQGLDGVAWYRKHFTLSEAQTRHNLEIGLARIDDHDITYINGHKVGENEKYNAIRTYKIDKKFLRTGDNSIAIRVLDSGGGGGIWSEQEQLYLRGPNVDMSLTGEWLFKVDKGEVTPASDRNHTPTALYNKMLHPLFKVPVKGVLWYQGESNAYDPEHAFAYREQFKAMIQDWRSKWQNDNLPFYWVQLANFISGADSEASSPWAILRESQTEVLSLPHTGMAVTIDVGDPNDIHPRDKNTVGKRLALHALKNDYGKSTLNTQGPRFAQAKVQGKKVLVSLHTASALVVPKGEKLQGFEIADKDGKWYPAEAKLKQDQVVLSSKQVKHPASVRYAWSDNPENANLSDSEGLPALPFRQLEI